jgi:hypothetical protein
MNVEILRFWNATYVKVDGVTYGPLCEKDAERVKIRSGNASKRNVLNFLKAAGAKKQCS